MSVKNALQNHVKCLLRSGFPFRVPMEGRDALNESNRQMAAAFQDEYGQAYLGHINITGEGEPLCLYDGKPIENFEYDFCVPFYDSGLVELIGRWNTTHDAGAISRIFQRIENDGGVPFIWS